ncbi:hypothetical protein HMJ29_16175 [Hymenobacter taeanensis]|uniref:Uncharacterized protein n=1 Tax=Hymenobacter taeanensis TaxID=2735321 RepID=A0A6M6BLP1_9BACT|nr:MULTISPECIES: hypothetical protein [Hymenobacter]QJX48373.1 hypothetical protein HMJ29_16175 [Hymenobacter taeanensis]UOQ82136.1 hypothetical protein MUN83_04985 [Hymenobacter sp. 5414T-23]
MATNDKSADNAVHDKAATPDNEQLENTKDFKELVSNGKQSDDSSAHRNQGAGGYTQRADQKDQLENLHINGGEGVPQGGNEHDNPGEQASGPGFGVEGSVELDHQLRTRDQKFGESAPSGPAKPVED